LLFFLGFEGANKLCTRSPCRYQNNDLVSTWQSEVLGVQSFTFFNLICESPIHKSMAVTSAMAAAEVCKRPNLFDGECHEVYQYLLKHSLRAQLPSGAILDATSLFAISSKIFSGIWKQGRLSLANGVDVANVSNRKTGNVGRKRKVITPDAITNILFMLVL
jgi:hypothetical protein